MLSWYLHKISLLFKYAYFYHTSANIMQRIDYHILINYFPFIHTYLDFET